VILNLLIATHRERTLYRNTLFFAAVNVAASALLISRFGELGAAIALLGTSAASQVALASLPATAPYVRPLLLSAARVFAAAIAGVAVARWSTLGAVPATALALAVYVGALVVLRVLNREELDFVRTVIAGATGASKS
jgi:O-antigen/teichoic acid export membrane protein